MKPLVFALALFLAAPAVAQPARLIYVNAAYDIARDPAVDLRAVMTRARAGHKRILVEVGGAWCVWCTILDRFLADDARARAAFAATFVVMKVNWSVENRNRAFLQAYPRSNGYPDFFILDADGAFLAQQPTGALEAGDSYDTDKMIAFAERWRVR